MTTEHEQGQPQEPQSESDTVVKHQGGGNQVVFVAMGYVGGQGVGMIPEQTAEQGITVADLPAADPHVKGQLWSNAGVITISQG